jgi:hypothetical protein
MKKLEFPCKLKFLQLPRSFVLDYCPATPYEFEIRGRLKIEGPKNRPFFRVGLIPTSNRALTEQI